MNSRTTTPSQRKLHTLSIVCLSISVCLALPLDQNPARNVLLSSVGLLFSYAAWHYFASSRRSRITEWATAIYILMITVATITCAATIITELRRWFG